MEVANVFTHTSTWKGEMAQAALAVSRRGRLRRRFGQDDLLPIVLVERSRNLEKLDALWLRQTLHQQRGNPQVLQERLPD